MGAISEFFCVFFGFSLRIGLGEDIKFKIRKEVIQPLLPERLPCYDLTPIAENDFPSESEGSTIPDFGGLTGGVCKRQERIHRGMTDPRLLPIPRS